MEEIERLIPFAKGDIDIVTVLFEIHKSEPMFLNPLGIALILTDSNFKTLLIVYNDICKGNIFETKRILSNWFDNSIQPLAVWIKDNNYTKE